MMIPLVHFNLYKTQKGLNMSIVLFFFQLQPTSLHFHASSILVLIESNFKEWYEHVQFTLDVLDLDMTLLVEKPVDITTDSTSE